MGLWGSLDMTPVTGLVWLAGWILSVHMGNFNPLTKLIFQPGCCSYGKFQLGERDENGMTFQVSSSGLPGWNVHTGKFPARVTEISVFCDRDLSNQVSLPSHMNTSKFSQRKEWWDEISETELARLTHMKKGSYEEAVSLNTCFHKATIVDETCWDKLNFSHSCKHCKQSVASALTL